MPDQVKLFLGERVFGVGDPVVLVTTQDQEENRWPGEYFLWVRDVPSLKLRSMHQSIVGEDTADAVAAGYALSQDEVEKQALNVAQGTLQQWQFEAYQNHHHDASLRVCELRASDEWRRSLYSLRLQGRLDHAVTTMIRSATISTSLNEFLSVLARVSPLRRGPAHPYEESL